jgi:epoxyqueuosine reductase
MHAADLTVALKEEAFRLGFDMVGATPAVVSPDFERFRQWIAEGNAGGMTYLADRLDERRHPNRLLDGVKSLLMLGTNYHTVEPIEPGVDQAKVSRYAWGGDYHELMRERLHRLADFHRRLTPHCEVRGVVDSAPLFERQFARLAGLGWVGKNNLLINPKFGSWFFLAALLTTETLQYDAPCIEDRCGSCRACLDACPTGALTAPRHIDARRCLSYLLIEQREAMPTALRSACGRRLYGCDACQEACPWNRDTPVTTEPTFYPSRGMNPVELAEIASLDEDAFRRRFRHSPLWRAKRDGILRNAEIIGDTSGS